MSLLDCAVILFLVVDPFGNLPFVLAVLREAPAAAYRRTMLRELLLALVVLVAFAAAGERILGLLAIREEALAVAGGVILFLISLHMIFRSAAEIFDEAYRDDPFLVPIAMPALAGPSAVTTVMMLRTQQEVTLETLVAALVIVFAVSAAVFLPGRRVNRILGRRGAGAMEKLMGMVLNLIAVNLILSGIESYFRA